MKHRATRLLLPSFLSLYLPGNLPAQDLSQTVKGVVLDRNVQTPLPGATVFIEGDRETLQSIADSTGAFRIAGVPLGRQTLRVQRLGYKTLEIKGVAVVSGKETDLTVELEENAVAAREVVVSAAAERQKPLNPFAVGSARSFSGEETQRYAAAFNDPARMASAFAGVAMPGDDNNTIVVRGNAPNGLLWRLEGVDIPNPNHFSSAGATGGGISILSAQVLAGSDFFTGAFPAEYGNALSGVFDLKLRKGNADRREYTLQAGLIGLEAAAEGPFRKGQDKGSFLFNYRYSSLALLTKMGIGIGDINTKFQDISFNLWRPAGSWGDFSLFGLGGLSSENEPGVADSAQWRQMPGKRANGIFRANTGVLGLVHQKSWGATHWKQVLAVSGSNNEDIFQLYQKDYSLRTLSGEQHRQHRLTFSSVLSRKLSARHFLRAGAYAARHGFDLAESVFDPGLERTIETIKNKGETATFDAFAQWQYRPSEKISVNGGLHVLYFFLNQKRSFEPRAAVQYAFSPRQSLGFSFDFTRANHWVATYRFAPGGGWHFKTEVYFQDLSRVPVSRDQPSSYSILNEEDGFVYGRLANTGRGRNYGLELSIEKSLERGFYLLASTSLYRSDYRASDRLWRQTRYSGNYLNNAVLGREWDWKGRKRPRTLAFNLKLTHAGGLRESPIDPAASQARKVTVRDNQKAYAAQLPYYLRLDLGLRLKRHYRHMTGTFFLDAQNATGRENVRGSYYNTFFRGVGYEYQEGLIPVLGYKAEF
jgi:CarboxypepD_reg-like domain